MSNSCPLAQLRAHFSTAHWPHFDGINQRENHCVIDMSIGSDMLWLEGHFPQQPVVAGVVQTHWAAELAKYLFNVGDEFIRIDNLKFQQVILPGQKLQLTLDYGVGAKSNAAAAGNTTSDSRAIKFRYSQGETIFSEGKLVFQ